MAQRTKKGEKDVLGLIEEANRSGVSELDLSNKQITAIPESLSCLTILQSLLLWSNQITVIPESLSRLTNLQSLDLSNNQITVIPGR